MLSFAHQEGRGRVGHGHTLWVLVDNNGPGEGVVDGAAALPVVAGRKGKNQKRREKEAGTERRVDRVTFLCIQAGLFTSNVS